VALRTPRRKIITRARHRQVCDRATMVKRKARSRQQRQAAGEEQRQQQQAAGEYHDAGVARDAPSSSSSSSSSPSNAPASAPADGLAALRLGGAAPKVYPELEHTQAVPIKVSCRAACRCMSASMLCVSVVVWSGSPGVWCEVCSLINARGSPSHGMPEASDLR
jgi:hypothetical protein